jgi:AraC-like DNA-binding protein
VSRDAGQATAPIPEKARYWRDGCLPGLELLSATFVTHRFKPHVHDTYAIGVCLSGAEGFAHQGRRHVLTPGSVVTINPGEAHTGEAAVPEGWVYRMFYPHPDLVRGMLDLGDGPPPCFSAPLAHDAQAARDVARLHAALSALPLDLARAGLFCEVFGNLFARHAKARPHGEEGERRAAKGVERARERMEANLTGEMRLDDLAALAGLSPWHFLRSFRQRFGLTPHAWLVQRRAALAAEHMRCGMPPAQAALEAGFADQSHLARHFKRVYGVTPGTYARGNFVQAGDAAAV